MIRLAIIDPEGQIVAPKDVATAMELLNLVEQARGIIRTCESLAREKGPKPPSAGAGLVPYLT